MTDYNTTKSVAVAATRHRAALLECDACTWRGFGEAQGLAPEKQQPNHLQNVHIAFHDTLCPRREQSISAKPGVEQRSQNQPQLRSLQQR